MTRLWPIASCAEPRRRTRWTCACLPCVRSRNGATRRPGIGRPSWSSTSLPSARAHRAEGVAGGRREDPGDRGAAIFQKLTIRLLAPAVLARQRLRGLAVLSWAMPEARRAPSSSKNCRSTGMRACVMRRSRPASHAPRTQGNRLLAETQTSSVWLRHRGRTSSPAVLVLKTATVYDRQNEGYLKPASARAAFSKKPRPITALLLESPRGSSLLQSPARQVSGRELCRRALSHGRDDPPRCGGGPSRFSAHATGEEFDISSLPYGAEVRKRRGHRGSSAQPPSGLECRGITVQVYVPEDDEQEQRGTAVRSPSEPSSRAVNLVETS